MSTRVYISAHEPGDARTLAASLKGYGFLIESTWHDQVEGSPGFLPDAEKAGRNFPQIENADVLVLIASPGLVTGGKFVEAGYALGYGTSVVILGRRENGLLASPGHFNQVDDVPALVAKLRELEEAGFSGC